MADKNKDQESKVSFTKGLKAEYKRIIWPDKDTLAKQAVAVTVVSLILGCIIALFDFGFKFGFGLIFK